MVLNSGARSNWKNSLKIRVTNGNLHYKDIFPTFRLTK
ncbi:hypothetical protein LEP1GSC005_2180 [Leptospira santarosai str. ST188]|nr:hypothetical protein LEP1GSC005_2180 [Leptospira santarosai str. ST188]